MANYTFEEIRLGLEIYGEFLLQETTDKQVISEIKLNFKGIKDLGSKALAKFKSLNTAEKTFVGLLGKLKKETGKEVSDIVKFIKSKSKEYKGKSLKDIQKDAEKLYSEFTGKKLDEALSDTARRIAAGLAMTLYIALNIGPAAIASSDALAGGDASIELAQSPDSKKSGNNPDDTIDYDDARAIVASALGADIPYDDVKDGVKDQKINIELGDVGGAISFDTGEFDATQDEIFKAAQDAVNALIDSLDGKDLKKVVIDYYGLISNTPGDQDNNEVGPGDDKLGQLRANTAEKIAKKAQELLKDKYPDADVQIGDSTTNINNVDNQKEVGRGSSEASTTQVAGISFDGPETEETTTGISVTDLLNKEKARIKGAKLELNDKSRFRAILFMFLPLLIDDFEETLKKIGISLELDDEDFPLKRATIEKKLNALKSKENKTQDDEDVIKVVQWAVGSSRRPRRLRAQINALDPKVNMGEKAFMIAKAAGSRGKDMGLPGSGFTQGNTGTQATSPSGPRGNRGSFRSSTVAEDVVSVLETLSLLLEAQTDFAELPNYNTSKAKDNLGILVPLYSAYWAGPGGLPLSFDIDYVMKQYKSTWNKFENDYPVIAGEKNWDDYVEVGDDGKPVKQPTDTKSSDKPSGDKPSSNKQDNDKPSSKDKKDDKKDPANMSFDKDAELEPETAKIKDLIDDISLLKTRLKLINNKEELQKLILAMVIYTNPTFIQSKQKVASALFKARNRFKPLKEEETLAQKLAKLDDKAGGAKIVDVLRVAKYLGKYPGLATALKRVNNEEELIELILVVVLPYVNPVLHKNPTVIKSAIVTAANEYRKLKPGEEIQAFMDKGGSGSINLKPNLKPLKEMSKKKIVKRDKLAKSIMKSAKKQYGKEEGESAAYAIATNMVKEKNCGCGKNPCETYNPIDSTISEIIEELVYEELCKRGKAYIAARKRAGEKSSAYLSGRAVKVCKGQMKGAGGKRKKSYRKKKRKVSETLYQQLRTQTLNYLNETFFNDPHFAIVAEYNVTEGNVDESLKNWFGREDWVRIDTQGNIAGKCGTMPKGKATQRCLPRAKANSLTKKQRAATSRKKVRGSKKGKQFVKNTKKAKVSFKKK